jgi:predicted transcriptional regulator
VHRIVEAVLPSTPLAQLMERLLATRNGALPCGPDDTGGYGLVTLDQAREIWNETQLDRVVIAADLSNKLPAVEVDADLIQALRMMDDTAVDALPVIEQSAALAPPRAIGVVTRADIGRFLFHQYARRQRQATKSGQFAVYDPPG